jgi:hypothetical protein
MHIVFPDNSRRKIMTRTMVATAAPLPKDAPTFLIVESVSGQREVWGEACEQLRVRRHCVGVFSALRLLTEDADRFAGVVLDNERYPMGASEMTGAQLKFLRCLTEGKVDCGVRGIKKIDYRGPLVGANMTAADPLLPKAVKLAGEALGCRYLIDGTDQTYEELLMWCLRGN